MPSSPTDVIDLRPAAPRVPLHQRVQFATLLQLAERGTATLAMTSAVCPGAGRRDFEAALACLLEQLSIEGPPGRLSSLVALAEAGQFTLTAVGQQRLDEDDV